MKMKNYPKLVRRDLSFVLSNDALTQSVESLNSTLNEDVEFGPKSSPEAGFEIADGWHFYAHLVLSGALLKSEESADAMRVAKIYQTYTRAARKAISATGNDHISLLEHQGVLLHFFLDFQRNDASAVIAFARALAASVRKSIFTDKEDDVVSFRMASEFGRSVIVKVPSATGQTSTFSRVSIGPCANDPAKKLLGGPDANPPAAWHLAYRDSDAKSGTWADADCASIEAGVEMLKESACINYSINAQIDFIADAPPEQPDQYNGFVFRADLDGFTERVRAAFASNDETRPVEVAQELADFIYDFNDWQACDNAFIGHKIIPFPWAGDCCNMVIYPVDSRGNKQGKLTKEEFNQLPPSTISSWKDFLAAANKRDGFGSWSFGMAAGNIKIFSVRVDGVDYRLMTGWPVGVSQEGVNLDGTNAGDLVMHNDDINEMDDYASGSFKPFVDQAGRHKHPEYKRQNDAGRNKVVRDMARIAAQTEESHGHHVPPTKPHSSIE